VAGDKTAAPTTAGGRPSAGGPAWRHAYTYRCADGRTHALFVEKKIKKMTAAHKEPRDKNNKGSKFKNEQK
jgi:hypothetical protein